MNNTIEEMLQAIDVENREQALRFWNDLQVHVPNAWGSIKSHHAWPGGYADHIQEVMNLATMLYERMNSERQLVFSLPSALLVLFLHDCEKPFKRATDEELEAFPWIQGRPTKSDKAFQKQLIEHYGFIISEDEWNALRYVEGEPDAEYIEGEKLQSPLAAFCHVCDTISARIWYDYPQR